MALARRHVESGRMTYSSQTTVAAAIAVCLFFTDIGQSRSANDAATVSRPARPYQADSVQLHSIKGTLIVDSNGSGPMVLKVSGSADRLERLQVTARDGTLFINGSNLPEQIAIDKLTIELTIPRKASIEVENFVGRATIGNLDGSLRFKAIETDAKIAHVAAASVTMFGRGSVEIAGVTGLLTSEISGDSKLKTGPVGSVRASIRVATAELGAVSGPADVNIMGEGSVHIAQAVAASVSMFGRGSVEIAGVTGLLTAEVRGDSKLKTGPVGSIRASISAGGIAELGAVGGPTDVDIMEGSVHIAQGVPNPLHARIVGSGSLDLDGMAVDPNIEGIGSAKVHLKSYSGQLEISGIVDLKIGD
jgi:hypothetical protein